MTHFYSNTYNGSTAVSFQFSRIGSDPGAAMLLHSLDRDPGIGEYIDVLPVKFDPKGEFPEKWFVVCRGLLFSKFIELKWPLADLVFVFEIIVTEDLAWRDLTGSKASLPQLSALTIR